jgi:hypothetical protein
LEEFEQVPDESIFFDITPNEATLFFFVLGLAVSEALTIDEINVLASGLFETAQVMFVIAAQRTLLNDRIEILQEKAAAEKPQKEHTTVQELEFKIKKLQDQIDLLQKQMKGLKL